MTGVRRRLSSWPGRARYNESASLEPEALLYVVRAHPGVQLVQVDDGEPGRQGDRVRAAAPTGGDDDFRPSSVPRPDVDFVRAAVEVGYI